jgi:hypothetical protein
VEEYGVIIIKIVGTRSGPKPVSTASETATKKLNETNYGDKRNLTRVIYSSLRTKNRKTDTYLSKAATFMAMVR